MDRRPSSMASTRSGASSVNWSTWDTKERSSLSAAASSITVANSPVSSMCFHRNASASGRIRVLSMRGRAGVHCCPPVGEMMILRPPRLRRVSGRWTVSDLLSSLWPLGGVREEAEGYPCPAQDASRLRAALALACHLQKNVELMHKFMSELGLSPVSRSRVATTHSMGPRPWEFTGQEDDELFS